MYPLLPALAKLLSPETRNAKAGAKPARQRRAISGRGHFGADPLIAMFGQCGTAGESYANLLELSIKFQGDLRSYPRLGRRGYPAISKVKMRKKRFG